MRREHADGVETLWLAPSQDGRGYLLADWSYIGECCAELQSDETVTVLVLRGEGEGLSVGADVVEVAANISTGSPEAGEKYKATTRGAIRSLVELPVPTIAVVEGRCVAGSTALVNACDVRIGTASASFEFPPARLGLVYPQISTELLVRAVGDAAAKWLLYSGRSVDAAEALRLGLLQELTPDAETGLARLLADLAAGAPASHRAHKRLITGVGDGDAAAIEAVGYASRRFAETAATRKGEMQ